MNLQRFLTSIFLIGLCHSGLATQAPTTTRAEINMLFKQLQISGCQFNRNGTWYSGAEAQSHLIKKLEYFENRDMIKTTEDFIQHAASLSSSSGKAYLVKCENTPATESAIWLHEQLKKLRKPK